jgi:UDP-N-acetylmuramoyl-tripeptide--D-alanyl-D-alanine ligase
MIDISAKDFANAVKGTLNQISESEILNQVPVLDSRKVKPGTFFVAIVGEKVDGHKFAESAIAGGAKFVLATKPVSVPHILVSDVAAALLDLTAFVRTKLSNCKVIGITGSNGKTTTKELLYGILSQVGETIATDGNLNTDYGVPHTFLRCTANTKYCVIEMGARHLGDISRLSKAVQPDVGVVLLVGTAHLGEFGSRENIAKAKSELISGISKTGTAILGTYDEFTSKMADGLGINVLKFGPHGEIRATDVELRGGYPKFELVTPRNREVVELPLVGAHQINNALAAAAATYALGIAPEIIANGLSNLEVKNQNRMFIKEFGSILVIDDSYNASPDAMQAALDTLNLLAQERGGASWAFVGKMAELGSLEQSAHLDIRKYAQTLRIDHFVSAKTDLYLPDLKSEKLTSDNSDSMECHLAKDLPAVLELVRHLQPADVVLVKASRSEQFEEIVQLIDQEWGSK